MQLELSEDEAAMAHDAMNAFLQREKGHMSSNEKRHALMLRSKFTVAWAAEKAANERDRMVEDRL